MLKNKIVSFILFALVTFSASAIGSFDNEENWDETNSNEKKNENKKIPEKGKILASLEKK